MQILRRFYAACIVAAFAGNTHAALVHHFKFDDTVSGVGDTLFDEITPSISAKLINGATTVDGKLVLNGSNQYVDFFAAIPFTGPFTVALFVQETSHLSGPVDLFAQGSPGSAIGLGYDAANGITGGDQWTSTGVSFPLDGLFHHYAYVSSATDTLLYIDGALAATRGAALGLVDNDPPYFFLGGRFDLVNGPIISNFVGRMEDLRVYDEALSATAIHDLANVPEPATMGMAILAGLALHRRLPLGRVRRSSVAR
jgi:hypothetical protein